jgi:hypothetical protein
LSSNFKKIFSLPIGVRKHMREEGENLKIILEGEGSSHENRLENDRQ